MYALTVVVYILNILNDILGGEGFGEGIKRYIFDFIGLKVNALLDTACDASREGFNFSLFEDRSELEGVPVDGCYFSDLLIIRPQRGQSDGLREVGEFGVQENRHMSDDLVDYVRLRGVVRATTIQYISYE